MSLSQEIVAEEEKTECACERAKSINSFTMLVPEDQGKTSSQIEASIAALQATYDVQTTGLDDDV